MRNRLLYCAFLTTLMACQREGSIQPNSSSPANEVAGTYRTNVYLDPSCVALSPNQMPYAELDVESDSTVTLVYTRLYPAKDVRRIANIRLNRQVDGIQLRLADTAVGSLQTDRIFTDNGMEKQGRLLRITMQDGSSSALYFAGYK